MRDELHARILAGYVESVKGTDKTMDDACNTLQWTTGRYMQALATAIELGLLEG